MALNGSVSVEATPKGQDLLVFSWSAVQDTAANTSTVSWMMQLVASTAGAINGVPVERDWSVTVDGQEFTGRADVNISNNETKTLATGEIVLEHNEDGTRSFDFTFSQAIYITWSGTTEIGVVSGSGTGELDAIVEPEPEPEKFDIQSFLTGLAMALCGRPVQWPKREPKAFLYGKPSENGNIGLRSGNVVTYYDGVVMPAIPDAVKEYRYQMLCVLSDGLKNLVGFNIAPETREFSSGGLFPSTDVRNGQFQEAPYYWQTAAANQTEWLADAAIVITGTTDYSLKTFKWANYDVLNLDGSVYLAASEPIPVSGIVGYIDDIPIYE